MFREIVVFCTSGNQLRGFEQVYQSSISPEWPDRKIGRTHISERSGLRIDGNSINVRGTVDAPIVASQLVDRIYRLTQSKCRYCEVLALKEGQIVVVLISDVRPMLFDEEF